jgi:hypothetical protein
MGRGFRMRDMGYAVDNTVDKKLVRAVTGKRRQETSGRRQKSEDRS